MKHEIHRLQIITGAKGTPLRRHAVHGQGLVAYDRNANFVGIVVCGSLLHLGDHRFAVGVALERLDPSPVNARPANPR